MHHMKIQATGTNPALLVTETSTHSRKALESEDVRLSKALSFSSLTITAAILSLSLGLAACQPKNGAAGASSPAANSAVAAAGTGDSGGGNGLDGKFFESYIMNPEQTLAWQTYMNPILQNLAYLPGHLGENAMWLVMGARAKRWYIAPIKLATLTKEQIGVEFIRDPIQQLALQTDREIWFDKAAYDGNPTPVAGDATCPKQLSGEECAVRNRAIGLLHETMVSLYMMQFMTMTELCAKYSDTPGGCAGIEKIEKSDPEVAPKPKRALDKNDYANIRTMTSWMFENGATVKSNDDVKMQFLKNGFDGRMYYLQKIESKGSTGSRAAEKINFTRDEMAKALVDATTLSKLPTICRSRNATQITSVSCAVKFSTSGAKNDVLEMALEVGVGSSNPVRINMATPAVFLSEKPELTNFWLPGMKSVGYMTFLGTGVVEGKPIKVGTDTYQVIVFFSEDKTSVRGIFLWQQRVTKLTPRPADEEKIMDAMVPGAQHVGYEWATPGESVLNDLQFVDSEFFSHEFYTLPSRSDSGAAWVKGGQNVR